MGLGQSNEGQAAKPISSHFSTTELTRLEQFYCLKEKLTQEQSEAAKKWDYQSIKDRITHTFDEAISTKIVNYMHMKSIAEGGGNIVSEQFLGLIYYLTKDSIRELAQTVYCIVGEGDEIVAKDSLKRFLTDFVHCLHKGSTSDITQFPTDKESCRRFVEKLLEHFPDKMKEADFDIMLHRTPLLIDILQYKFRLCFFDYISEGSKEVQGTLPWLIPKLEAAQTPVNQQTFLLPLPSVIFLNSRLPMPEQQKWRLLYSSKIHGESFSKMTGAMTGKGPTLLVVRDTHGHVFGGYTSTSWEFSAQFQGTNKSFLFTAEPKLAVYDCTSGSYNDHFMYLNIGQETMPNGLGMGGQLNFFGLWLDQEFGKGHSRAKPACTTYGSPQLSKEEEFKVEAVTVWGVGDEPRNVDQDEDYDENMTSVLDKHVEAKALLEIAGKPRVSEGLRDLEPDADIPETKELQIARDPMT